jgi:NAD(P)-dependent dehydrogenase (short-subunit alcohol dehydrogenase family)
MSGKLSGRVAIVTGGARGQGAAAVRQFVAEGARVVIADVLEGEGAALARELGTATLYQRLDVADEQSWHALVERATKEWGRIDVLLNNAGILLVARLVDVRKPDFQKILDVNLLGPWLHHQCLLDRSLMGNDRHGRLPDKQVGAAWSDKDCGDGVGAVRGPRQCNISGRREYANGERCQ